MNAKLLPMLIAGGALALAAIPAGDADATYGMANVAEARNTMFNTFMLMSILAAGFCALAAHISRTSDSITQLPEEPNSVVVPQIRQESNIVHAIVQS